MHITISGRTGYGLLAINSVTSLAILWAIGSTPTQSATQDVIRARLIELVDEKGLVKAQIHLAEDGSGQLRLKAANGDLRVKLGPTSSGGAALLLMDRKTEPGVRLATDVSTPSLTLTAPDKRRRKITP